MPKRTESTDGGVRNTPVSLAPLSFEEALEGLLRVAPPPKDERVEPEPEREPPQEPPRRKRQPKRDKEQGSR